MESYSPLNGSAKSDRWRVGWVVIGLAALIAMFAYVLTRAEGPIFDEVHYFVQADAFGASDSFKAWLVNNDTGPVGPVHALMHNALSAGRGVLPAPWFRLPNLVLLASVLAMIAMQLRDAHIRAPWAGALVGLAVPMTWVMTGMALTELPAMVGVAAACCAAGKLGAGSGRTIVAGLVLAAVIALSVTMAICGRQTYLLVVPAILLLAARDLRSIVYATSGIILGLVPPLWLFATWGGLVPPKMAIVGSDLRLDHGLQALCYAGVTVLLVAPPFFRLHWRGSLFVSAGVIALNMIVHAVHFAPMATVHKMMGNGVLVRACMWGAGQIFLMAGAFFVVTTLSEIWARRDRKFSAYAVAVLGLCAGCAAISHQFSSRYVGMSLPFIIPMLARWIEFTPWAVMRWLAGMGLGFATLHSYYVAH